MNNRNKRNNPKNKGGRGQRQDRGQRQGQRRNDDRKQNQGQRNFNEQRDYRRKPDRDEFNENVIIEGRNPIMEALNAGRTIERIIVKTGELEGSINEIIDIANQKNIKIERKPKEILDDMSETGSHQGILAEIKAKDYVEISDILAYAKSKDEDPFIIMLDGITDPHNLGAIIRTAECAGAHGVIIPSRRSASLSGTVGKTSAGAVSFMNVAKVTNLVRTMEELKEKGLWIAAGTMDGTDYYEENLKGPICLVIGGEGDGVSRLIGERSDHHVKIPMYGEIGSLNASVAAGLLMYEVVRQRNFV